MKDHPGCSEFARITTNMLNVDLRPVTAKWHRAYEAGVLNSRDGANDFRADLARVRRRLVEFAEALQRMAYGQVVQDEVTRDVLEPDEIAECLLPLQFGIDRAENCWNAIATSEAQEIEGRRAAAGALASAGFDAVGLALSGGGIRSATFCLGVVQVLSERGLMKDIDYLSTVSGGGYTGSFISSLIGSGADFDQLARPFGPDTAAVRHIRQNAKYLSAVDLKERWMMVAGTVAGLILNWSAPVAILSLLALCASNIRFGSDNWVATSGGLMLFTLLAIILHGIAIRWSAGVWTRVLVGSCVAGAIFCAAMTMLEWGYAKFRSPHEASLSVVTAMVVIVAPLIARFLPVFRNERYRKVLFKITLYAAGFVAPLLAVLTFYILRDLGSSKIAPDASWWNPLHYAGGQYVLGLIFAVSALVSSLLINVNLTGLHKLYRDQLAKTFIWPPGTSDIWLKQMNPERRAPYHLINATVNLPSSTSPVLRDRKGDFFLFSKCWSGSRAVRYSATEHWNTNGRPVDLATVMAISGAAASPQMGLGSIPTLSALMTLLNIRLGFWIANPKRPAPWGPPGFSCILREMTGAFMSERNTWLNVSDGGHIENMGLYELLRRRCKFIICVDGEADPESTFHGQLTLVRHAQIDFGIQIEPRLDEMRPDPHSRFSRTHAQLFRIKYPATMDGRSAGLGLMLYLKLSLTGDEAELLKRYRILNPDFPHQSTIDQFYDEEQFEAYRQLGVHVAEGTFARVLMIRNPHPSNVREWFEQLVANMLEPTER
jgi:predicted acylesterase/phospholipase RssA